MAANVESMFYVRDKPWYGRREYAAGVQHPEDAGRTESEIL